jgi:alkylated DNA repair dioxygenase AlkB
VCAGLSARGRTLEDVDVAWQGSLFEEAVPDREPLSFDGLRRDALDDRSWLDVVPGWVTDHGALFELLLAEASWQQRTRTMWDKDVLEPRMIALVPQPFPAYVQELVDPLNARYGVELDSCLVNLYRDGNDAVAWHADTVRKTMRDPLVATVSLGARRTFLVRPVDGGAVVRRYKPGEGDLIVMGGAMQHDWHHTVPREKTASGARMSVTLRHSRPTAASAPAAAPGTPPAASPPSP